MRGICKFPSIAKIKGVFKSGVLHGLVTIVGSPQTYFLTHGRVKDGVLNGRLVTFGAKPLYDNK